MNSSQDILIIGAGPVGLMMACELRRHGVSCRLVERLEKAAPHCKALGVTPRTLEMWDDLGIVQQALSAGMGLKGAVNVVSGDERQQEKVGIALPEGAYGFLVLAQYDTERILTDCFISLGGQIERGVELIGLGQSENAVRVTLKHADGSSETVECQYLLGCDGGRSAVRRALNVPFEGEHYEQTFFLVDVELDGDFERGYAYRMVRLENSKPVGGGACIPVPGNPRRYRFSTVAPEAMIPAQLTSAGQPTQGIADIGPTLLQAQELLSSFFPDAKASNLRWSAFYRISHRLAAKYRVGRVFLAGDAAHLHPPIGGQGMNAGLQDAYNLGWKLALHVQGLAADGLLDSYEAERRPIGQQIVERTTKRMNKMFEGKVDEQEPIRDDSQLFLNYRGSGIVQDDLDEALPPHPGSLPKGEGVSSQRGPMAGERAPDVRGLQRGFMRHELRMFDLLRGPHHALLLYTASADPAADCQKFAAIAAALFERFAGRIQTYAIIHPDCDIPEIEGLPIIADRRNEFALAYHPQSGSGFLIRPDGYVGYRAEAIELNRLQSHLQRVFKGCFKTEVSARQEPRPPTF